tara:strand:- start:32 stop:1210 length:1179 start_codon:yes stop_codon:yes gene_type:complete
MKIPEHMQESYYTFNYNKPIISYNDPNKYYPQFLFLIGIFYILPSLQFVFFQSQDTNIECYYNFKCYNKVGVIPAFNSVISNIFYILYGLIYIVIVRVYHKYKVTDDNDLGVNKSPYLYYALGISLIFEGICSATYHICPTKLNFQFDTTFMFIGGILMFITIYGKQHTEPNPMKIYSFLGFLIFINILPLSGLTTEFEQYFWGGIFIVVAYIMITVSVHLYYGKEYELESFKTIFKNMKHVKRKDVPKLLMLVTLNCFTLGTYLWAVITQANFTDWVLGLIIINMLLYFCYYLIQKLINRDNISFIIWCWIVIDLIIVILSLLFYVKTSTNTFLSPEQSKELNEPCIIFNYFDYHDVWHILSATGLFIFMIIVFFLDSNIIGMIDSNINIL